MEVIDTMPTNARHHRITNKRDTPVIHNQKQLFCSDLGIILPVQTAGVRNPPLYFLVDYRNPVEATY